MSTTDLKLEDPGSLVRPGPVGRLVRLGVGVLCLQFVWHVWDWRERLMASEAKALAGEVLGIAIGLYLVSYVVNIGFSRDWGRKPLVASLLLFAAAAGVAQATAGTPLAWPLGPVLLVWLLYVFAHLGVSFALSALLGTPGCEMRGLHNLYSLITGRKTKEHYCPIGPLHRIDKWEAGRRKNHEP